MGYQIADIKQAADCRTFLADRGFRPKRRSADQWFFNCPWKPGSDSESFAVWRDGWKYYAGNDNGSIIDLFMKLDNLDIVSAIVAAGEYYNLDSDADHTPKRQPPKTVTEKRVHEYTATDGIRHTKTIEKNSDGSKRAYWSDGRKAATLHLYNHDALADADMIVVVEGEKDVDNLTAGGIVATSLPDGASSKWQPNYADDFVGKKVCIIPDNDAPGADYAAALQSHLQGLADCVRILNLGGAAGADVSDWLEAKGTPTALRKLIADAFDKAPDDSATHTPVLDAYYLEGKKEYVTRNQRGAWLKLNQTQIKRRLLRAGLSAKKQKGDPMSEIDEFILDLEEHRDIYYAGPLAGHWAGFYDRCPRYLVTSSPAIPQPAKGNCNTITNYIYSLLADQSHEQAQYFMAWLKIAYESLQARKIRPGQAIAIAGPRDCGKSLLQQIITHILGGRVARPYQYMTGFTSFNGDLFEAEHLMIDDETASTDIRARRNLGTYIKQFTVSPDQRCHPKGGQAVVLRPFWRVTISCNDEPENLMVLPPMDDSIADKLMLFRANPADIPHFANRDEYDNYMTTLLSEVPAFLHDLLAWEIPADLVDRRFGVKHFHHPDIVQSLVSLAPETKLLELIDRYILAPTSPDWKGTAADLEHDLLKSDNPCGHEARKLLSWNNSCGTYLGRLAKLYPSRIKCCRSGTSRDWEISL